MVLVPLEVVSQYHVSPTGGLPLRVNVTPTSAHCGEFDVGFPGLEGDAFTVIKTEAVLYGEVTPVHVPAPPIVKMHL